MEFTVPLCLNRNCGLREDNFFKKPKKQIKNKSCIDGEEIKRRRKEEEIVLYKEKLCLRLQENSNAKPLLVTNLKYSVMRF